MMISVQVLVGFFTLMIALVTADGYGDDGLPPFLAGIGVASFGWALARFLADHLEWAS